MFFCIWLSIWICSVGILRISFLGFSWILHRLRYYVSLWCLWLGVSYDTNFSWSICIVHSSVNVELFGAVLPVIVILRFPLRIWSMVCCILPIFGADYVEVASLWSISFFCWGSSFVIWGMLSVGWLFRSCLRKWLSNCMSWVSVYLVSLVVVCCLIVCDYDYRIYLISFNVKYILDIIQL